MTPNLIPDRELPPMAWWQRDQSTPRRTLHQSEAPFQACCSFGGLRALTAVNATK